MMKVQNFVDGERKDSISGQQAKIKSAFYPLFDIEIPNSDAVDLAIALSSTKKAQKEVEKLSMQDRMNVLKKAAKNFKIENDEIEYAVKMLGMPRKTIIERVKNIQYMLEKRYEFSKKRYNLVHKDFFHHHFDKNAFVYKRPLDKLACAFVPGNDITVAAFVMSHAVMSGARIIIKPSKEEPYFAIKIAEELTKAGYPKGAINVLIWDSADRERKNMAHALIAETQVRIIFGDDPTLQAMRFQEMENGQTHDHGVNGKFILYGAGRSKAIVNQDVNVKKVAQSIAHGSLNYYIGCTSTKTVFVHEKIYSDFLKEIQKEFGKKNVGSPLDEKTDIGYSKDIKKVLERIHEGLRFSSIRLLNGMPKLKNDHQLEKPVLLEAHDLNSEFLKQEYAIPILTLYKYSGTLKDGIELLNEASYISDEQTKSIAVGVYTSSAKKELQNILRINAHHINVNVPSSYQHLGLPHQSKYLKDEFTEDISVSIF